MCGAVASEGPQKGVGAPTCRRGGGGRALHGVAWVVPRSGSGGPGNLREAVTSVPTHEGVHFRVTNKHRLPVPYAPLDMVTEERAQHLDLLRKELANA